MHIAGVLTHHFFWKLNWQEGTQDCKTTHQTPEIAKTKLEQFDFYDVELKDKLVITAGHFHERNPKIGLLNRTEGALDVNWAPAKLIKELQGKQSETSQRYIGSQVQAEDLGIGFGRPGHLKQTKCLLPWA